MCGLGQGGGGFETPTPTQKQKQKLFSGKFMKKGRFVLECYVIYKIPLTPTPRELNPAWGINQ